MSAPPEGSVASGGGGASVPIFEAVVQSRDQSKNTKKRERSQDSRRGDVRNRIDGRQVTPGVGIDEPSWQNTDHGSKKIDSEANICQPRDKVNEKERKKRHQSQE